MGAGGNECFGGNWKLIRLLGTGSYGQVFEAERVDFGKKYRAAIKAISIPQNDSELDSVRSEGMSEADATAYFRQYVEQLVKEFEIMSELKGCSNVVNYEDHEVIPHSDGIGWDIYIRMELLTPLTKKIRSGMNVGDVIRLGIDICRALELCRQKRIIHRDIKPENIFVSDFGDYKLGDFGIARTLNTASLGLSKKGTYSYMAPEVYLGREYGTSADIYSLGIVLYRLLNGNRTPFLPPYPQPITHSDRENAISRQMTGSSPIPLPDKADPDLARVVLRACAYAPADRFRSPTEMADALEELRSSYSEDELQRNVLESTEDASVGTEPIFAVPSVNQAAKTPTDEPMTAVLPRPQDVVTQRPAAPVTAPAAAPVTAPAAAPASSKNKKKKLKIIIPCCAAALVVLVALIVVLGPALKTQRSENRHGTPSSAQVSPSQKVRQTAEPTADESENAEWQDDFPKKEYIAGNTIEMKTWYRSSPVVISEEKDIASGELYYSELEAASDWSEWQLEPIEPGDLIEVETQTVYYYRNLVSWRAHDATHTATWTEYGWSSWMECGPEKTAVPGSVEVRNEIQYRCRTLREIYYYAKEWTDWGEEYVAPGENEVVNVKRMYRIAAGQTEGKTAGMDNFSRDTGSCAVLADVEPGMWYHDGIYAAVSSGIMVPDEYLFFHPSDCVTVGEVVMAASMINRIYNGESAAMTTDPEAYRTFLADSINRGIVNENEFDDMTAYATRADVASVIYRALPDFEYPRRNVVDSITDMSSETPEYKYVKWLAEAGVLSWSRANGVFSPDNYISRAEFATIIDRVIFPEDRVG